jgi:hypothetical protein
VYVLLNDASGAAKAQQIVAEDQPNQNTYGTLALYLYAGGDLGAGDQAAKKSVSMAPKSVRKQVKQQLDQTRAQAVKFKKQQAKAQKKAQNSPNPSGEPLTSPFGNLPSGP